MQLDQRSGCLVFGVNECVNMYVNTQRLMYLEILQGFIEYSRSDVSHFIELYCMKE